MVYPELKVIYVNTSKKNIFEENRNKNVLFKNKSDGDCYDKSTSNYCSNQDPSCTVYASESSRVPSCQNQFADYLHLRYRCVPGI